MESVALSLFLVGECTLAPEGIDTQLTLSADSCRAGHLFAG